MTDQERARLEALVHRWSHLEWRYRTLADREDNPHSRAIATIYAICIKQLNEVIGEL